MKYLKAEFLTNNQLLLRKYTMVSAFGSTNITISSLQDK